MFRILFGLLLVSLASYMVLHARRPRPSRPPKWRGRPAGAAVRARHIAAGTGQVFDYEFNEGRAVAFNVAVGFISAFFGTGGGFIRTPVLVPDLRLGRGRADSG